MESSNINCSQWRHKQDQYALDHVFRGQYRGAISYSKCENPTKVKKTKKNKNCDQNKTSYRYKTKHLYCDQSQMAQKLKTPNFDKILYLKNTNCNKIQYLK